MVSEYQKNILHPKGVIHLPDKFSNNIQKCFRCGCILVDHKNTMVIGTRKDGNITIQSHWEVGLPLYHYKNFWTTDKNDLKNIQLEECVKELNAA